LRAVLNGRFTLVASSILVCLVAVEAGLRISGYKPFANLLGGREKIIRPSSAPGRVYEAVPCSSGHIWNTDVAINSLGFRDDEFVFKGNDVRIAVLGDSIAFGLGLPAEETFPRLLEGLLRRNHESARVMNLGLGGYNTYQQVATLESVIQVVQPHYVVVVFCVNDILAASPNMAYTEILAPYRPLLRLRVGQLLVRALLQQDHENFVRKKNDPAVFRADHEHLMSDIRDDLVLGDLRDSLEHLLGKSRGVNFAVRMYGSEPHLAHLRFALERLSGLARRHGFRVVLLEVPYLGEGPTDRALLDVVYAIVEHESIRVGLDHVSAREEFVKRGLESLRLRPAEVIHPNRLGHAILAQILSFHYRDISTRGRDGVQRSDASTSEGFKRD
jgi:lysophospholipase L1-like esterase